MSGNPHPALAWAVRAKERRADLHSADSLAHRAWDALMSALLPAYPGLTLAEAVALGIVTPAELSAAHAWAARSPQ